ncbi:PocR ligand-binding domain-containing protein [Pontiella sulfatireligans]|uniref:HTH-type transcriptional activator Btr n=1 Tax=Pontiella sulfatireligans TaxID=2750658 RepID=A0A6C2URM7_9BACT|nr:PocR ligand-binding domain-containing protein [Pontiella sulfatireligans]VGO22908.1 HTH-type transcriptional activator Btr [Pontiella sulfatireligans]
MQRAMEYIFTDEMLKLLDHFTSLTEVRIAFFSMDGEELCIGKNRSICDFCSMRRRSQAFNAGCLADDQHGREVAQENGGVYFYQCHAGLCEAVVPVYAAEVPIGYAMIGQFRLAGAAEAGRNQRELQALKKLPVFTREKVDDLLSMFEVLIQHIASQSLVGRRDFDLLGPLIERMRARPEELLTLTEAARFVGLSASRLSHLFSAMMGTNFKRFQITQRLDLADRLMKAHPDWRMARIAEACGFEDPLYFSRVYKKHRGVPPSKAIKG